MCNYRLVSEWHLEVAGSHLVKLITKCAVPPERGARYQTILALLASGAHTTVSLGLYLLGPTLSPSLLL